jgi:hypothetical protein
VQRRIGLDLGLAIQNFFMHVRIKNIDAAGSPLLKTKMVNFALQNRKFKELLWTTLMSCSRVGRI